MMSQSGSKKGSDSSHTSIDLLSKISAVMRDKLKILDNTKTETTKRITKHVPNSGSSSNLSGKTYRNIAPVFSIHDESDLPTSSALANSFDNTNHSLDYDETREVVSLQLWRNTPDCLKIFECEEVKINGQMFPSFLALTESHVIVLRRVAINSKDGDMVEVIIRRPLSSIIKITKKKRHPNLISFHYGQLDHDQVVCYFLKKKVFKILLLIRTNC